MAQMLELSNERCPAHGGDLLPSEDKPMKKSTYGLLVLLSLLLTASIGFAQESRAVVSGRMTDASGANAPGAKFVA
jgi:hypothetical protein